MSTPIRITGNGLNADVRRGLLNGRPGGLVTYNAELYNWRQRSILFIDENGSRDMNIDGSASGTPDGIHNGGDSALWTASALSGTWAFTDTTNPQSGTQAIRAFNMNDGDIASFDKGSDLNFGSYEAFSGWIDLSRFNDVTQGILFGFYESGVIVGNQISIGDYIDGALTGTYQKFVIPKADFGIGSQLVDELQIEVVRPSGSSLRFDLDNLQIEETAGVRFEAKPLPGTYFEYNRVEFTVADNIPMTVTNGTATGLAYDQFMGLASLSAGLSFQQVIDAVPDIAVILRNLCDFYSSTFYVDAPVSDGTNSMIKLTVDLPVYSALRTDQEDSVVITVNDDLTGLLALRCILIGRELIPHEG